MYWITLAQATHPDSGHLKNISQNTLCPESHEPLLFSLLQKLLASQSGIVGPGSIVDAGCHDGVETCWLAASARDRQVHAIEPLGRNLEAMQSASWYRQLRNVHPLLGALGEKPGWLRLPARLANANVGVMLSGSNRLAAKRSDSNLTVPQQLMTWRGRSSLSFVGRQRQSCTLAHY